MSEPTAPPTAAKALDDRDHAVAAAVRRVALHAGEDAAAASAAGLAAAAVSAAEGRGSTCLGVDELPAGSTWPAVLAASAAVAVRDAGDRSTTREHPLVFERDAGLLFTARSWFFQERLAANLAARLGSGCHALQGVGDEGAEDATHPRAGVAPDALRRLFPDADTPEGADAFAAAAAFGASRFGVLTGGPGTGKTTAAARLLAGFLLAEEAAGRDPAALSIALATPTGKAAERLTASVQSAAPGLAAPAAIRAQLGALEATTLHRLLGWTPAPPERGGPFRHTAERPLPHGVVLVDEASMVGLEMMARLVDAVRPDARLLLMGDANQLASVEAGGVLAELVTAGKPGHPLEGRVFHLRHSRRFEPGGEIDRLARAVLQGDADAAVGQLTSADREALATFSPTVRGLVPQVLDLLEADREAAAPLGEAEAFRLRNSGVRVLTALRSGPSGEAGISSACSTPPRPAPASTTPPPGPTAAPCSSPAMTPKPASPMATSACSNAPPAPPAPPAASPASSSRRPTGFAPSRSP